MDGGGRCQIRPFKSIRPTNRTVYGDLESRRFTAVNFEPRPIAEGRYQNAMPQDVNGGNLVPKPDLTR
jgi:hypothetical protein